MTERFPWVRGSPAIVAPVGTEASPFAYVPFLGSGMLLVRDATTVTFMDWATTTASLTHRSRAVQRHHQGPSWNFTDREAGL